MAVVSRDRDFHLKMMVHDTKIMLIDEPFMIGITGFEFSSKGLFRQNFIDVTIMNIQTGKIEGFSHVPLQDEGNKDYFTVNGCEYMLHKMKLYKSDRK